MRISDWSSDVCSSDLRRRRRHGRRRHGRRQRMRPECIAAVAQVLGQAPTPAQIRNIETRLARSMRAEAAADPQAWLALPLADQLQAARSEEHTSELQSLMRISYAGFCFKKKTYHN